MEILSPSDPFHHLLKRTDFIARRGDKFVTAVDLWAELDRRLTMFPGLH